MTSVHSKSEGSDFEPDNSFFDSFLDGMDILIDNGENSEEGYHSSVSARRANCTHKTEREIPSIDLSDPSKEASKDLQCLGRRDEITKNVLAHLEKTLRHRRHSNYRYNSCSTNRVVVDVLNRLKRSVQQKESPSSSSNRSHPEAQHMYKDVKQKYSISDDVRQPSQNNEEKCSSHSGSGESENSDIEINAVNSNKTVKMLVKNKDARSHLTYWSNEEHSSAPCTTNREGVEAEWMQEKGKKEKHRKRKLSKKAAKRSSSKSRKTKRHSSRNRHGRKRKTGTGTLTASAEDASEADEKGLNTEASLESVSSADDDILNRVSSGEENGTNSCRRMVTSPGYPRGFTELDREEGEVLTSSSSDCETRRSSRNDRRSSERIVHRRHFIADHCIPPFPRSPEESRSRGWKNRRSPSPVWPRKHLRRLCSEEVEELIYRPRSPPQNYLRLSPREDCSSEVPGGTVRVIHRPRDERRCVPAPYLNRPENPVPPFFPRPRSRPRSPMMDQLCHEAIPFIDNGERAAIKFPRRHCDYHLRFESRRLSPSFTGAVPESHHSFQRCLHTEINPVKEALPLSVVKDRTSPLEDDGKRSKSPILLRCLREVRYLLRKPGRFVYDPDLAGRTDTRTIRRNGPFSSPVTVCLPSSRSLGFTAPRSRTVGTSTRLHTNSVSCQADDVKPEDLNMDKTSLSCKEGLCEETKRNASTNLSS